MAFAIVAVSLDLIWGYAGLLCLCQAFFFCLGGYAMGMYLAHHGGPEGIIDHNGWKLPACLYVVYPYKVGESPGDALVPWFWKPFWSLWSTLILGLLIPGFVAGLIGFFVFRSRVRGVFFAVLTQAITLGGVARFHPERHQVRRHERPYTLRPGRSWARMKKCRFKSTRSVWRTSIFRRSRSARAIDHYAATIQGRVGHEFDNLVPDDRPPRAASAGT